LTIFGTTIPETTGHQMAVQFPTYFLSIKSSLCLLFIVPVTVVPTNKSAFQRI